MSDSIIDNQETGTQPVPYATAVLVLGIISIPTCFCYGIVGLTTGIVALALASKGKRAYHFEMGKYSTSSYKNLHAGKVCAIIGTSLSGLYLLYFIAIMTTVISAGTIPFRP